MAPSETLILGRGDVRRLLDMPACIDAVEQAFIQHARGATISPGILGAHARDGVFHVKTAGMQSAMPDSHAVFAAKVNANFPGNPDRHGLPTIQGVIALFNAHTGQLLALFDSIEITSLRTAAATAVAAKHLAREESTLLTVCGCGEQGRSQLRALACVRPLSRVFAFDSVTARAVDFATAMSNELGIEVSAVRELGDQTLASDIWVTCTPARRWILGRQHVAPGTFIAGVGADNHDKQEIEPELLAANVVVADILDQCATIGDLHHAFDRGLMRREDVRAELADVIAGRKPGRQTADEIIVFDSTGTALEDVAAATLVYELAVKSGMGIPVNLISSGARPPN